MLHQSEPPPLPYEPSLEKHGEPSQSDSELWLEQESLDSPPESWMRQLEPPERPSSFMDFVFVESFLIFFFTYTRVEAAVGVVDFGLQEGW